MPPNKYFPAIICKIFIQTCKETHLNNEKKQKNAQICCKSVFHNKIFRHFHLTK